MENRQPKMWNIYKKVWISASHQILANGYTGKCSNLHGHNYKIEVWMTTHQLNPFGMVEDYNRIKNVCDLLDHKHLNDVMDTDAPTAENMAEWIHNSLVSLCAMKGSIRVRVWETSTSYAEFWD